MDRRGFVGIMFLAAAGCVLGFRLTRKIRPAAEGLREAMHYRKA